MIEYRLKWERDLEMYIHTFGSFVFEGNINDLQPVKGDTGYSYIPLTDAIAKKYCEEYCVVFYDHTKQCGASAQNEDDDAAPIQQTQGNVQTSEEEKMFGPFSFYGEGNETNKELLKKFFSKEYVRASEEEHSNRMRGAGVDDIRRILDTMSGFKVNAEESGNMKPFLFLLPNVSRYMTMPGQLDERETAIMMLLLGATQLTDSPCRLMLFVDKMNDLPTWFESESSNSALKKIFVPNPDNRFRETFFETEMGEVMEGLPEDEGERGRCAWKFAAHTENYSLRRLQQLKKFIQHGKGEKPEYGRIEEIEKTTMAFSVGVTDNPWSGAELRDAIGNFVGAASKEIKGQAAAIIRVSRALKSAVAGVDRVDVNSARPKAIFFFAGPTGTGKTELAKQIAEKIFGNRDSMIRFDMSEFREEHTDARLFGAPPGYVGYEAGGELTTAIKQNPFSVVLFDEIEKASPRIWDKFLQILGDGRLTDGKGETVSFSHSVIIFTSNLGVTADENITNETKIAKLREIYSGVEEKLKKLREATAAGCEDAELAREIREDLKNAIVYSGVKVEAREHPLFREYFALLGKRDADSAFNEFVSDGIKSRIKGYFDGIGRREVYGRIGDDNIIVYHFVSEAVAEQIATRNIDKYIAGRAAQYTLEVTEAAKDYIKNRVISPDVRNFGGRGVVNCVEQLMKNALSNVVFNHPDIKAIELIVNEETDELEGRLIEKRG